MKNSFMNYDEQTQYLYGFHKALDFADSLRKLRKISHESTLLEMYGCKREKIGHIANIAQTTDHFLYGVMRAIYLLNTLSENEHFSLWFDDKSNWIQVSIQWE